MAMTKEQISKKMDLLKIIKPVKAFSVYGHVFLGNKIVAVEEYVRCNPSDKFYIRLIKNYTSVSI